MQDFLKLADWTWSSNPTFFGPLHIIYLILSPTLMVLFAWLLRKSNEKQNKIILLSIGIFLILTEIWKHLFYWFVVHNASGEYPWWIFSWQLCSIPMYVVCFAPFIKKARVRRAFYDFLLAFAGLGGIMMHLEPSGAFTINHIVLTFHSLVWHSLLLFIAMYLAISNRAGRRLLDFFPGLIIFGGTAVIAEIINVIFYYTIGVPLNMFFISPFRRTTIAIFSNIYDAAGPWASIPLYLFALCLGGFLIHFCTYYIRKIINIHNPTKYITILDDNK